MNLDQDWRGGSFIRTFTGKQVDPLNIRQEDIDLLDVAHSLSLQCRYMGHCAGFYSVAEHCIYVSNALRRAGHDKQTQREGLLHDASEAYLMDVPRPIKSSSQFEIYRKIEADLELAVAVRFKLMYPMPPEIKEADMAVYEAEQYCVRDFGGRYTPAEAERRFLELYWSLVPPCG